MMSKKIIIRRKYIVFENILCFFMGVAATASIVYMLMLQLVENIFEPFVCVFYIVAALLYFVIWILKIGLRTTQRSIVYKIEASIVFGLCILGVVLACQGKAIWNCAKGSHIHTYQSEAVILVLGGELKDNKLTPILEQRLNTALECYKENPQAAFLCSGGKGNETGNVAEAVVMKEYLIENGVDEDIIYCETESASTYENFANSSMYISPDKKIIIVTSDFHAYRAGMMAHAVGMNYSEIWLSKTDPLVFYYYFFREILGCLAWKVGIY